MNRDGALEIMDAAIRALENFQPTNVLPDPAIVEGLKQARAALSSPCACGGREGSVIVLDEETAKALDLILDGQEAHTRLLDLVTRGKSPMGQAVRLVRTQFPALPEEAS